MEAVAAYAAVVTSSTADFVAHGMPMWNAILGSVLAFRIILFERRGEGSDGTYANY